MELYNKITSYQLDDPLSKLPLTKRVAIENRWSIDFAQAVGEEYLKFAFLCCISKQPLTPSDQVDQIWHMHMLYTREYEVFCQEYLGKKLHHGPTKGGEKEGQKFEEWYAYTLELYGKEFGEKPPANIWPSVKERFEAAYWARINLRTHIVIRIPQWFSKLIT